MIVVDRHELGDTRLSPEESLCKLKEGNAALIETRKIAGQRELEDPNRAAGPRLEWREIIWRLQQCNPGLLFKDGSPGQIAVYAPKTRAQREADGYDFTKPGWYNDFKYVGGFPKDWLPEYSTVITDERGLAKREVRGWRSILIGLIKAEAITYRGAVKHFGEAHGQRATRWLAQTRNYKYGW